MLISFIHLMPENELKSMPISRYSADSTLLNNCLLRMKITQPARIRIEAKRAIFFALPGSRSINLLRLPRERPFLSASSIIPIRACWESAPSSSSSSEAELVSADKSAALFYPFSMSNSFVFLRDDCFYGSRLALVMELLGGKPNLRSLLSRAFLSVELTLFAFWTVRTS